MKQDDGRIVWKNLSDLKLILLINQFIEKYGIKSSRQYQKKLSENPNSAPSMWFINQKYGSWDNLLESIGLEKNDYGKWAKMPEDKLMEIVESFISDEKIRSQRNYETKSVGRDVPSLSTLKKIVGDVRPLFRKKEQKNLLTDFQLLMELREEIIRLGLEEDLSMTKFRKLSRSDKLPSAITILRRTNKSWEELMEEIGFDYRKIKIYKQRDNLSRKKS
ncbi:MULTISPECIES: hypothetical protein [Enterococcus]|nr:MULTISPECIES: hypothetical protein [Enterococcus]